MLLNDDFVGVFVLLVCDYGGGGWATTRWTAAAITVNVYAAVGRKLPICNREWLQREGCGVPLNFDGDDLYRLIPWWKRMCADVFVADGAGATLSSYASANRGRHLIVRHLKPANVDFRADCQKGDFMFNFAIG